MTMTSSALQKLLTTHGGGRAEGSRVVLETGATLFVRIGTQSMTIERVKQIDVEEEMCVSTTARNEVYAFAVDDIRAVRFEGQRNVAGLTP